MSENNQMGAMLKAMLRDSEPSEGGPYTHTFTPPEQILCGTDGLVCEWSIGWDHMDLRPCPNHLEPALHFTLTTDHESHTTE